MNNYVLICGQFATNIMNFERFWCDILSLSLLIGWSRIDDLGLSLSSEDFYNKLKEGSNPKTSQITINEYTLFFEMFFSSGEDILHIAFSSGLSGSYNCAIFIKNNKITNNNKKIRNKKNSVNNENQNNLSNSLIIDEINNLNDIFKSKNRDLNNTINVGWKQMNIYNIISNTKLNSNKKDEIMYKGNINKLVLSHIFKNCSMNIEKFCILTKEDFSIFHTKENFLLMKKPLFKILLNQVENCGRIDFSQLRINNLNGHFFMYINMKSEEEKYNLDNHEDDDDIIYKIVLKEGIGKFFVLFSNKENLIDEWVCAINYFIQKKEN